MVWCFVPSMGSFGTVVWRFVPCLGSFGTLVLMSKTFIDFEVV